MVPIKENLSSHVEVNGNSNSEEHFANDKFYVIYILFFLLGLVHRLPLTFFTTATAYWMYKFRNTTITETHSKFRTGLQAQFNASFKISLQVSQMVFTILTIAFGRLLRTRIRMLGSISIILIVFVIITVFIKIDTDSWQQGFFAMIMTAMAIINAMMATFTITMYTIMANFPHHYLAPFLTAGSLSKVFTAALQILSLALGISTEGSALIYFSVGVFVFAFTLISFFLTNRNEFYLYNMKNFQEGQREKLISFSEGNHIFKKIWSCIAMMGFYFLAVDICPTALVVSEGEGNGPWNDIYFIPTITYLLGAVFELIGKSMVFRYAPNIGGIGWNILAAIRLVVFVPLFMFSNVQPRHHLPVVLSHDYQYIIMVIVFNFTGGYLYSLSNYNVAKLVDKKELKQAYDVIMFFVGLETAVLSSLSVTP